MNYHRNKCSISKHKGEEKGNSTFGIRYWCETVQPDESVIGRNSRNYNCQRSTAVQNIMISQNNRICK